MSDEKANPITPPAATEVSAAADVTPVGASASVVKPPAREAGGDDPLTFRHFARHWRLVAWPLLLALLFAAGFGLFGVMSYRAYFVADSRVKTFYDLEMYEGDMAIQAMRVLDGKELYPKRDSDYIPLLYNPLSSYLQAAAMKILDPPGKPHTLYAGRMVSVCATWIVLVVLFLWVYRETRHPFAALAAPLYFVAINPFVGWWFDLFRVDMIFIAFMALGSWPFLDRRDKGDKLEILKGCLAGFFYACAFFTKQTAGPLGILLTFMALFISPLRGVWAMSIGLSFGLLGQIYFNWANQDFWYLTVIVPSKHVQVAGNWLPAIAKDYLLPAGPALAVVTAWLILVPARRQWRMLTAIPMLAIAAMASLRGLITMGGYINHYLTLWFFTVLYFGIGLGSILPHVGAAARDRKRLAVFGAAALILWGVLTVVCLSPQFHALLDSQLYKQVNPNAPAKPPFTWARAFADWWQIPFYCAIASALVWLGFSARWQAPARPRPKVFAATPLAMIALAALAVSLHSGVIRWGEVRPSAQPRAASNPGKSTVAAPGFNFRYVLSPGQNGFARNFLGQLRWEKQMESLKWKIPNREDAIRGANLIQGIRRLDGDVWIPHGNYYTYLAGRNPDISSDHVRDLSIGGQGVMPHVIKMLDAQKYKYILLNNVNIDHDWQAHEVSHAIKRNYVMRENWDQAFGPGALRPVDRTGQKPRALLVRKRDAETAAPQAAPPVKTAAPPAPVPPPASPPVIPRPVITPRPPAAAPVPVDAAPTIP